MGRSRADAVVLASHPPLFGFAGSLTLIGFAYGMWPGALIAVCSSCLGAGLTFISIRVGRCMDVCRAVLMKQTFFLGWTQRTIKNPQWEAFGKVMKAKGLPLIIMIRACPIPWAIGNALFAVGLLSITLPDPKVAVIQLLTIITIVVSPAQRSSLSRASNSPNSCSPT